MVKIANSAASIAQPTYLVDSTSGSASISGKQETFVLAAANTASSPAIVSGGSYILSVLATTWGTIQPRFRGADGSTMLNLGSALTGNGAIELKLGTNAVIDVVLTGTTAAAATLARVP